jgi:hypothetical protein
MLTTMRILVVEDERKVASFIKRGLEATHYSAGTQTPSIQAKGRRLVFRLGLSPFDNSRLDQRRRTLRSRHRSIYY